MSLVPDSARLAGHPKWRQLVQAMQQAGNDPAHDCALLRELAMREQPLKFWVLPTGDLAEARLLEAGVNLSRAWVLADSLRRRTAWSTPLLALAEAMGDALDASEPAAPPPPRYRADIDG